MNKTKWSIAIIATAVSLFSVISIIYTKYLIDDVDCVGNFNIHNNVQRMSLLIDRKLSRGQGIDTISGTLYNKNEPIAQIERTIRYTYEDQNGKYILKSVSIVKGVHDKISDDQLSSFLPSMYVHKDGKNIIFMKNIGRSGWMVYENPTPLYFCKRN